jgi:hypothetical protein
MDAVGTAMRAHVGDYGLRRIAKIKASTWGERGALGCGGSRYGDSAWKTLRLRGEALPVMRITYTVGEDHALGELHAEAVAYGPY